MNSSELKKGHLSLHVITYPANPFTPKDPNVVRIARFSKLLNLLLNS